jgi:hypothetical protein
MNTGWEVFMYCKSLFVIALIVISAGFLSGGVAENATENGSAEQSVTTASAQHDDFFSTDTSSSGITVTFKRLGNNTARTPVSLGSRNLTASAEAKMRKECNVRIQCDAEQKLSK